MAVVRDYNSAGVCNCTTVAAGSYKKDVARCYRKGGVHNCMTAWDIRYRKDGGTLNWMAADTPNSWGADTGPALQFDSGLVSGLIGYVDPPAGVVPVPAGGVAAFPLGTFFVGLG